MFRTMCVHHATTPPRHHALPQCCHTLHCVCASVKHRTQCGANLNDVTVNSDQVALTSTQCVNGLALNHNFGGGNASGSRQALQTYLVQIGATQSVANGKDPYFVSGAFYSIARYSEASTPKSPQPGHQMGFSSDLKSLGLRVLMRPPPG